MESAMGSSKRALNTRSHARNARGQFASVKTEVGATAAPKQIILVYSSDSDGAPAPKEKVATSAAAVDKKMFSSVATRTRAVAAGKKSASDAPALTGKKGSATVNKLQVFVEEKSSEEDVSDVSSYTWVTDNSCDNSGDNSCDCLYHHRPAHMDGLQWALKRAKNEAMACVDASAATYSREAKKDINGIFADLYDEIKAKYKPKK